MRVVLTVLAICLMFPLYGAETVAPTFNSNPPVEIHKYLRLDEKLTYVVKWNGFPIGKVVSSVWPVCREFEGKSAFLFQLSVETNDFVSLFYKIRSNLASLVDTQNGWSYLFRRRVLEGDYRGNDRVDFDYNLTGPLGNPTPQAQPALIRWEEVEHLKPYPLPGKVCDPVNMIWYLRAIPLQRRGDFAKILLADRYGLAVVGWRVKEIGELFLPRMGTYDCVVISPQAHSYQSGKDLLGMVESAELWLEKNTRIIMRAVADTSYGRISVTLVNEDNTPLKQHNLTPVKKK